MSIGDSSLGICNTALAALGEDPITSLSDNNKRARLCNQEYDKARRAVLLRFPWSDAKKQASLAADTTAPDFDWQARYAKPSDFIRFYAQAEVDEMATWQMIGDYIYSNDGPPLNIYYVYDLQDCTKMSPALVDAIALELVQRIGLPLTQSQSRVEKASKRFVDTLQTGQNIDSQQNAPREWDVDILLRARR